MNPRLSRVSGLKNKQTVDKGGTIQVGTNGHLVLIPAALPALATKGELWVDTAGILYVATATNVWTKVGVQV